MPAKLNFFKTPASVRLVSRRTVSTSTGISATQADSHAGSKVYIWNVFDCVLAVPFLQLIRMHFCTVGHVHSEPRTRICKRLRSPGIDSKEPIPPAYEAWRARARIVKHLWIPRIDSKETNPPGCVAWRAGTPTLYILVPSPHRLF